MSTTLPSNPNPRVRLSPRGLIHIIYGKQDDDWRQGRTICGRKVADHPKAELVEGGLICRHCEHTPIVTFTFASGRRLDYYAK